MCRFITVLITILLIAGCERPGRVTLEGSITGGAGEKIYLDEIRVGEIVSLDSVEINKNDRFRFKRKFDTPRFLRLRLSPANHITLFSNPGEKITVNASSENLINTYEVEGSEESEKLRQLNKRLLKTRKEIDSLIKKIDDIEDESALASAEEETDRQIDSILQQQRNFSIRFIMENIDSPVSITALYQELYDDYVLNRVSDIQYMKIVAEALEESYPGLDYVQSLSADASRQMEQYELFRITSRAESEGMVIETYPDISLPDLRGDTITLSSLEEKYILVTFGSSGNEESTRFHLNMIPVYNTFRNRGFAVYHISMESDPEEWRRYVTFNEYPWVKVAEFNTDSSPARIYNVRELPANFFINRDIGVIARDLAPSEIRRRLSVALD